MDTWTHRDLPVLMALVAHFDETSRRISPERIAELAGFDVADVHRALRALDRADPPHLEGIRAYQLDYPFSITAVTERAMRAVRQWPTSEGLADRITEALEEVALDPSTPH